MCFSSNSLLFSGRKRPRKPAPRPRPQNYPMGSANPSRGFRAARPRRRPPGPRPSRACSGWPFELTGAYAMDCTTGKVLGGSTGKVHGGDPDPSTAHAACRAPNGPRPLGALAHYARSSRAWGLDS